MISPYIFYVLPIENDKDEMPFTPFQGFSHGVFNIPPFIDKILHLPTNIRELFLKRDTAISLRMAGGSYYNIFPIEKKYLPDLPILIELPFICFFSDNLTYKDISAYISKHDHPILHVTTQPSNDSEIHINEVNRVHFVDYINKTIEYIRPHISNNDLKYLKDVIKENIEWEISPVAINKKEHLVPLPNQLVLSSFNFTFKGTEPIVGVSDEPYIDSVVESSNAIIRERDKVALSKDSFFPFPPGVTLVLTATSVFRDLYRIKKKLKKDMYEPLNKALRAMQKQKSFRIETTANELKAILSSDIGNFVFSLRAKETLAYTMAISVLACNNFCPTLRLPPSVNSIHPHLEELGKRARGSGKKRQYKLNKLFKRITKKLHDNVPDDYLKYLDRNNCIKIVSDVPLEWLPVRELPLMLRFDTSRIPTTPGNVLFQVATSGKLDILTQDDFKNILVIRSFDKNDPLRNLLKFSIEEIYKPQNLEPLYNALNKNEKTKRLIPSDKSEPKNQLDINIHWVDVKNENDLINALNNYKGALLIFDGHGVHHDVGELVIGKQLVELPKLKYSARIPPIILLSACDTHPIDKSHASSANGFLIAGATTVLATLLPIDGREAALFLARLILRLRMFLPEVINLRSSIRWTEVISGLQRMSYITDIYFNLINENILKNEKETYFRVSTLANHYINTGNPNWYESTLQALSEETTKSIDEMKSIINCWTKFSNCLKYIQVGNPDHIIIANKKIANVLKKNVFEINQNAT